MLTCDRHAQLPKGEVDCLRARDVGLLESSVNPHIPFLLGRIVFNLRSMGASTKLNQILRVVYYDNGDSH